MSYKNMDAEMSAKLKNRSIVAVAMDARMFANGSCDDIYSQLSDDLVVIKHYLKNWTPPFHTGHEKVDCCVKELLEATLLEIGLREE